MNVARIGAFPFACNVEISKSNMGCPLENILKEMCYENLWYRGPGFAERDR